MVPTLPTRVNILKINFEIRAASEGERAPGKSMLRTAVMPLGRAYPSVSDTYREGHHAARPQVVPRDGGALPLCCRLSRGLRQGALGGRGKRLRGRLAGGRCVVRWHGGAAGSAASPADSMDASLANTYSAHGALLATIDAGVRAATELDMYAIVDWHVLHDQNPLPNFAAAQKDGSSSRGSGPANQL